jgi:uncharacterized membrane protein YccC
MSERRRQVDRRTVVEAGSLAVAVVVSWYVVVPLAHVVLGQGNADAEIGGMWSVVAAAFVFSDQVRTSGHTFTGRMTATLISSGLCFAYLLVWPFTVWAIALIVGVGVVILAAVGLQAETVTTSITTAVVLVVAGLDGSAHGWEDPLIRIVTTAIGGLVGVAAAWGASALRNTRRAAKPV